MARIAVHDDVLEGLMKAAQAIGRLVEEGRLPADSVVATVAASALESVGTPFLPDGRLGPDVDRALLWVGRDQIGSQLADIPDEAVVEILNGDWSGLGQQAFDARDEHLATLGAAYAPPSPTV
jgi:hypothetical protein